MTKELEQELSKLLDILMAGNPEQIRNTKKEIEKLCNNERKAFHKSTNVAFRIPT